MIDRLLAVAPYAAGFCLVALACLGAGVLIAHVLAGNGPDEACPEWVSVDDARGRPVWAPCPHRLPCPLHNSRSHRGR